MAKRKPQPPKVSVADPMTEVEDDDDQDSPGISDDVVWLEQQPEQDERPKPKRRRRPRNGTN
jgi:hypothetical protein